VHTEERLRLSGAENTGRETGGLMLSINGLHNFYYLPELHDMRCKAQRICEIIRGRYHRDPLNGDVYMFMSKDQRKVHMIHYERNAYYLHEKSFIKGYKFMKIERKNDVTVYKIDWKDLVTILETPVITSIRI
jgi:transposase